MDYSERRVVVKDIDFYNSEGPDIEPQPECKDLSCYYHGGKGVGCMTDGPCIYEPETEE
jgi:hypothetical protein